MKYRLFTVADPSDSKKIGSADTVNFLPEINKQGQLCWRSRPGLYVPGGGGWNFDTGYADLLEVTLYKSTTTVSYSNVGNIIPYRYELKNTGSQTAFLETPYTVIDDKILVEFPQIPARLEPGESIVYIQNYVIDQDDIDARSVVNTAYATAWHDDMLVTSDPPVTVTVNYVAPPEGCTHNVTMANLPGFKGWDVVDNETGNYSCTPAPTDAYEFILNTTFSAGTKKTCYFIIRFLDVSVGEFGWTLYLDIQNGYGDWPTFTPFPGYPMGYVPPPISTLCYVNIPDDATSLFFDTGNPVGDPSPPTAGSVFIECVMIVNRDWMAAGENAATIYDENGDIII